MVYSVILPEGFAPSKGHTVSWLTRKYTFIYAPALLRFSQNPQMLNNCKWRYL